MDEKAKHSEYARTPRGERVLKNTCLATHKKIEHAQPLQKTKSAKNTPRMPFSGPGSALFGVLVLSSSFWPGSRPILPNLGRIRANVLFLEVLVQLFMLQKIHFFVHLRYVDISDPRPNWYLRRPVLTKSVRIGPAEAQRMPNPHTRIPHSKLYRFR